MKTSRLLAGFHSAASLFRWALLAIAGVSDLPAQPSSEVAPLLERYCHDCHDTDLRKGDLDLTTLPFDLTDRKASAIWVKVHDAVADGDMPPAKKPQPTATERATILSGLNRELTAADRQLQARTGRVQFRRLNRVEYENTLRDLLELPGLEVKEMLPADAEAHGFDNVGSALRISYVQVARYLDAARKALNQAAWLAPRIERYQFRLPFPEIRRFEITKDRVTIGDEAVLLRQPNTAQTPWRIDNVQIPFPGTHTIRVRGRAATYVQDGPLEDGVGRLLPPRAPQIVSVYQGTRWLGSFDLAAEAKEYEVTGWLHADETIFLYVPTLDDWNPQWVKEAYQGPAIALEWIEFDGPRETDSPTASYRRLFDDLPVVEWTAASRFAEPPAIGELKHPKRWPKIALPPKQTRYMVASDKPLADARRLLQHFLDRAFRRPAPKGEVDRYLKLVERSLANHKTFDAAMIDGYVAVLASPDFLFFQEQPGLLDAHALADRLAYFIWRSLPDTELRRLADNGKLRDRQVLVAQLERLLGDPKAQRFVRDFTDLWLDLREIRATQPDEKLYPEFDDFLLESMVGETRAFFGTMLRDNLPTRNAIASDFVFANNVLAELYGLPDVAGVRMREVPLPASSPRGGLLTQASVLKVTANGTTTSPVVRGAWILDRLLGTPPPPPPASVPAIEPDTRGTTTIREQLAKHRADPACAGCHAQIDPPGFALESFDVIGGWRDRYRSLEIGDPVKRLVDSRPVQYRLALPVDSTGNFADGRPFKDVVEFRHHLLTDERQIARNLARRLTVFATGAGISFADRQIVEEILDRTRASGFGIRDLIREIVVSDLFRHK